MKPILIERNVGRCLTEYQRVNLEILLPKMQSFIKYSQSDLNRENPIEVKEPICFNGEELYGIDSLGNKHFLKSIVDSSD